VPRPTVEAWVRGEIRKLPTTPGWTRQMCIDGVQAVAAELGRTPGSELVRTDDRLPSVKTWLRFFPTWNALVVAAGLQPNRPGPRKRAVGERQALR